MLRSNFRHLLENDATTGLYRDSGETRIDTTDKNEGTLILTGSINVKC
jgi:hypothetical protein